MKNLIFILLMNLVYISYSQDLLSYYDSIQTESNHNYKSKLDKKFLVGFQYNLSWSGVSDIDSVNVFTKPSVGAHIVADYFLFDWLGFSIGAGHQMRGFGAYTPDYNKDLGNPDSTHRLRYRTNNLDIPIQIILRTPFEFLNIGKFSLAVGITPTMVYMARSVFISAEDGFHDVNDVKNEFISGFDIPLHFGAGVEINAGNSALFRLHGFAEIGTKPTYISPSLGTTSGANRLYGLQMSVLF